MKVLMVGVGPKRVGGMQAVADQYKKNTVYNTYVQLTYVSTSTNGSAALRLIYMLIGYMKIIWLLNTKKFDLVHIHMAEKGSTFRKGRVAEWAKKKEKKVIIHLHAGPFMAWYKTVPFSKQKRIKKIFEYADTVFVLGEYWKNELSEIIPEEKLIVLYNGVDCPSENNYNLYARNIVYFGVMRKEKGTYDLINAIKIIDDRLPNDCKVILCGNDLEGNVAEVIKNAGLENRFLLPGWVEGTAKEEIYQNAMIDVLPSYYEGLSMTILEAMAKGIPIVTTNISTMPEVTGFKETLITPGDTLALAKQILFLVKNVDERKLLSEEEYQIVKETFSESEFIKNTLAQYEKLVN